jgi:multicomponent Na+:H+ antiporter subunit B
MTALSRFVARLLLLPLLMVAFGVLVKGYADIGDGFAAGVIAGLSFVLQAIEMGPDEFDRLPLVRYAPIGAFVGLFLALAVAFGPVLAGGPILLHWPGSGNHVVHFGMLEFFTPLLFDIGVFLIVLGFSVGALGAIGRETQRRAREQDISSDSGGTGGMPS